MPNVAGDAGPDPSPSVTGRSIYVTWTVTTDVSYLVVVVFTSRQPPEVDRQEFLLVPVLGLNPDHSEMHTKMCTGVSCDCDWCSPASIVQFEVAYNWLLLGGWVCGVGGNGGRYNNMGMLITGSLLKGRGPIYPQRPTRPNLAPSSAPQLPLPTHSPTSTNC